MTELESQYLFHQGTMYETYKYMGCVPTDSGAFFRVWAPNATSVKVVGDFNNWKEQAMTRITEKGIWEIFIEGVKSGDEYKYVIYSQDERHFKSDPYARRSLTREYTNSIVAEFDFEWTDESYINRRNKIDIFTSPMNIYEAHIGSWKEGAKDYRSFCDEILPYLKDMGYTHIELMGICEYPLDDSWGYQVTGYYAPTGRYGSAADFAYLVNKFHSEGIGVILDWVPGHFPKNENGLATFDGSCLYEPEDPLRREHKTWGTLCFDYAKNEVRSFLIGSAMMWLREYHVDGLRVDAVASMLYLDYDRSEWRPNKYGGKENLDAVAFLRQFNYAVHMIPGVFTVAEESTEWPKVTHDIYSDGLGFDFKWNMGWMNDSLRYLATDPYFRKDHHHKMTFSLTYAFNENYILPVSHDEVVHGKGSLMTRAVGSYEQKFATLKAYYAYMMMHPGKKLTFMGCELAQFDEWNFRTEIGWNLLGYEKHAEYHNFVRRMNKIYLKYKALHEVDGNWMGFEWKVVDDCDHNIYAMERKDLAGNRMLALINFSPVRYNNYTVEASGDYKTVLYEDMMGGKLSLQKGEKFMSLGFGGYAVVLLYKHEEKQ